MARNEAFVGRDEQLAELLDHWHRSAGGTGRFVVLSGEAGIGKTRLVDELVIEIDAGARVAWGACVGSGAPPLWPWRTVMNDVGDPGRRSTTLVGASDLADPVSDQTRWSARLVEDLRAASLDHPLVVVLDDLHWADPDSAALLPMVVGMARRARLLVVATLRPSEVSAGSTLHATLTDLASSTEVVALAGLTADAVGQLVAALTGREPSAGLTAAVLERTAGNPFYVREVMRLLVAEGTFDTASTSGELPVPPLVRDVLLQRAAQLSSATRSVLDTAAVAGREIALPVLARLTGSSSSALVSVVDDAEAARLVTVADGRLRFAHDLIRDALLDGIDAAKRRRLHLEVGRALHDTGDGDRLSGEIAGHLLDALPSGDPAEAAAAALHAGRHSLAHHAPAEAVRYLERGLAVLDDGRSPSRGAMLLALGEGFSTAGDRSAARDAFLAASDAGRVAGDHDLFAAAAIGFAGVMGTPRTDQAQVDLLEEAFANLERRRDALAARVMARLAHALLFSDQRARRLQLADEAVALARECGDDHALASALYAWNLVHITSANYEQRLQRADELLALGRASSDEEAEAWALHFHAHHMAEGGDYAAFDADVAACDVIARRTDAATWQWTSLVHRAMRAGMQGRFDDAETLANTAFELGARSQYELAGAVFAANLVALRTWQGRLDELLPMIAAAAGDLAEVPALWACVPYAHAEIGLQAEAAEELRRIMVDRVLEDVPGAQSWSVALAMLARAAALTGQADVAERVRGLLAPLGDRHIVGPFADCYFGPARLYVGLCSATIGAVDDACAHLEQAVAQATAVGARPVAAWAKAELADALGRRGDDPRRVAALRTEAVAEQAELGMPRHLARVGEPAPAVGPNVFRRDGEGWSITFGGRSVSVRHTKGLADLHRLIASGIELHALELAQEAEGEPLRAGTREPILDERAKAEFRRRVLDLQAEADDARACADLVRAERADVELDRVVSELAAGLGFGGRDRTVADEAERARQAVRARIRYTLDRLEQVHPELRRHLDRAVVTGTFCSYQPEGETTWRTA